MKIDFSELALTIINSRRSPKLTIALAAIVVVLTLIGALKESIDAPLESLLVLLAISALCLIFTAWLVEKVIGIKK